jgi:hypothetical protein
MFIDGKIESENQPREQQLGGITVDRNLLFTMAKPFILDEALFDINPQTYVENSRGKADILTFRERLPRTTKMFKNLKEYNVFCEEDNVAGVPLVSYDYWFNDQIGRKTRNMLRKAQKLGVSTRICQFDDNLVKGIEQVYNSSPTRQAVPFTHYGETFDRIKRNLQTVKKYPQEFIGAFYKEEMIGFIQLLLSKEIATISQILSVQKHWDKAPTNALIAKAVEMSCKRGVKYLAYGKMYYPRATSRSSLREFKIRNGFQEMPIRRYYIPLSIRGKLILTLRLQQGMLKIFPRWMEDLLYSKRGWLISLRVAYGRSLKRIISYRLPKNVGA